MISLTAKKMRVAAALAPPIRAWIPVVHMCTGLAMVIVMPAATTSTAISTEATVMVVCIRHKHQQNLQHQLPQTFADVDAAVAEVRALVAAVDHDRQSLVDRSTEALHAALAGYQALGGDAGARSALVGAGVRRVRLLLPAHMAARVKLLSEVEEGRFVSQRSHTQTAIRRHLFLPRRAWICRR